MAHTLTYLRIAAAVTCRLARLTSGLRVYALAGRDSHPLDRYSEFQNAADDVLPFRPAFPGHFRDATHRVLLYVLAAIEHHNRRLIHFNVTAHPRAQWTRQQLREVVGYEERYEYLLHDRDAIFSAELMSAMVDLPSQPRARCQNCCT